MHINCLAYTVQLLPLDAPEITTSVGQLNPAAHALACKATDTKSDSSFSLPTLCLKREASSLDLSFSSVATLVILGGVQS